MPNHYQDTNYTGVQCRPQQSEVKEQFYMSLLTDYDLLPLFEQQYNAFISTRRYSLRTNEKLSSRWHDRVVGNEVVAGVRTMPIDSDYHFHNCRMKLMASQSPSNYPTLRKHLVAGPGVDKFGHRPIPADMMYRKTENPPPPKNKIKKRTIHQPDARNM